jgi:N-acyl-D-aspartate/D-glutamate deacylase
MRRAFYIIAVISLLYISLPLFAEEYEIIIKGGLIFDGVSNEPFRGDIGIRDGRIVKVASSLKGNAKKIISAKGLTVAPGFIDLHTHVDEGMNFEENRACLNYLKQGVTTAVVGQCGSSAWPIFEKPENQIKMWEEKGIGLNLALLIGHGTVREIVMGRENREPTPEELEKMKLIVREGMEAGAFGMSTGLIYAPSSYAKTDEIIELMKVVAEYGGIYHSHIRNERDKLLEAVQEAIEISEKTGAPAHISHFKVLGKDNWGMAPKACELIEKAREKGLKITADQYPFPFSNNYPYTPLVPRNAWIGEEKALTMEDFEKILDYLRDNELIELYSKTTPFYPLSPSHIDFLKNLPRKRLVSFVARNVFELSNWRGPENTRERVLFWRRLQDPLEGKKIREEVRKYIDRYGPENIVIGVCVEKRFEGKNLLEISRMKGKSIEDTAIELELMGAKAIPIIMSEKDIEYIMKKDYVATGSDGIATFYGIGLPHIRSYSTFIHKIKEYSLKRKVISLSHAIRSMTSLPADIMGFKERGRIKEGNYADIVILDLKKLDTPSTITNPHQFAKGVIYLLVNGVVVIEKEEWTGKLPGKVLRLKKN